MNTTQEKFLFKKTSLYKIFFIIAFLSFLTFKLLFDLIQHRKEIYERETKALPMQGVTTFSILKDHFVKYKNNTRYDIFTYNIPDETGEIFEVSEIVDVETRKLLRVGDTVECFRKAFWLEGRRVVISRIKKNRIEIHEFEFMLSFARFGIYFSLGISVLALVFYLKEKLNFEKNS